MTSIRAIKIESRKLEPFPLLEDVFGSVGRIRILSILLSHGEMNISKLTRFAQISFSYLQRHIQNLIALQLVGEKRYGRSHLIYYDDTSTLGMLVKEIILSWPTYS